jgi:hypothetical protein
MVTHRTLGLSALKALGLESQLVESLQIVIEPSDVVRVIASIVPSYDQLNEMKDWLENEVSEYRLVPIDKEAS